MKKTRKRFLYSFAIALTAPLVYGGVTAVWFRHGSIDWKGVFAMFLFGLVLMMIDLNTEFGVIAAQKKAEETLEKHLTDPRKGTRADSGSQ